MNKQFKEAFDNAETFTPDEPQPLIRKVDPATAFPVAALGDVLGKAALAIHDITQAPLSMCGQSVLAAATLAAQGLADVKLPRGGGKGRPLSGFFVTVAATGERKSTVDNLALAPVRMREGALREQYAEQAKEYGLKTKAYEAAAKKATKGEKGKDTLVAIEANLRALGDAPLPPLQPILTCTDPTIEGLGKMLLNAWPETHIALSDLIRNGPNSVRDNATARRVLDVLAATGHMQETLQPVTIQGKRRRQSWRIIGKAVAG